ncbi:NADP-dependent oxidoreductase [Bailinhaonella thermotolerans]|uniref:NADP-dependent oxidoreductase n=1 Tax=Bailinhaonella thermotolerans TaxID=1070861 RepID=A0A3A4ATR0_9ACTN|nr:NADP-dependent oxidoreductase [Bailinhaonella thermotolerans]RJL22932.1 NADP-dependent oxidoreductase [Bailinhaonella thermotolerans]
MSATGLKGREIRLAARPHGEPRLDQFALVHTEIPEPADGQVLVRNRWMSVDPYMRGRMNDAPSYIPPFRLGAPLEGSAVGEVIASRAPAIPVGATVSHFLGWRDYAVLDAADATVVDTALAPPVAYLGALGTTGLTAYAAFTRVAPVRRGDTVFVSAAAGAVGSIAGQLARRLGAVKVIGSAGGPDKAARLVEDFGFDVGLDRRQGSIGARLAEAAPEGIDVYLDNVGGDHLEAAIDAARVGARFALVGAIAQYNATGPVCAPRNLYTAYGKELTLRGLLVNSYFPLFPEWIGQAAGWLADGSLREEHTVVDGLEQAPAALLGVLRGANIGKMLVRLEVE